MDMDLGFSGCGVVDLECGFGYALGGLGVVRICWDEVGSFWGKELLCFEG
jgi:hypothetical protein